MAGSPAGPSGFVTDVRGLPLTTPGRRQTTCRAEQRAAGVSGRLRGRWTSLPRGRRASALRNRARLAPAVPHAAGGDGVAPSATPGVLLAVPPTWSGPAASAAVRSRRARRGGRVNGSCPSPRPRSSGGMIVVDGEAATEITAPRQPICGEACGQVFLFRLSQDSCILAIQTTRCRRRGVTIAGVDVMALAR